MDAVQVIAHRGARGMAPENTLEAIALAARQAADAGELDVQLSADGEVVVLHDDTLVRTTDARLRFPDRAPWWVADFTLAELRRLDAGAWFVDELARDPTTRQPFLHSLTNDERDRWIDPAALARFGSGAVRIPTLVECLAACAALGLASHVELKAVPRFPPALVERALAAIDASGERARVTVSSFDHRLLARVRALDAGLPTAVLARDRLADPVDYLARLDAQAYHPGCQGDDDTIGFQSVDGALDHATIAALRAAGRAINVWTENDPVRMRRLVDAGVSGIFTDYPARLRAIVDARRAPAGRAAPA